MQYDTTIMKEFFTPVSAMHPAIDSLPTPMTVCYMDVANPVQYAQYKHELAEFVCLPNNWDGYGVTPLELAAYMNANLFLEQLSRNVLAHLSTDALQPTPYGTVVMDFKRGEDLVSVEIGNNSIGFFTHFREKRNFCSEGDLYPFSSIPEKLQKALTIIDNAL